MDTQTALQDWWDGASARFQAQRATEGMTLGSMIEELRRLGDAPVHGLGDLASYRGYYADLAFRPTGTTRPASEVLADCEAAMGRVFEGYKGGEYTMGERTPLWVACWGDCGPRLVSLKVAGNGVYPVTEHPDE